MPTKRATKSQPAISSTARTLSAPATSGTLSAGTRSKANTLAKAQVKVPANDGSKARAHAWGVLKILKLDSILLGDNPRTEFDEDDLQELALSIEEVGVLQPLLVAECGDDLELIAGGRRWRACKIAGLDEAPCYVRKMTREQIVIARLAENLKRKDLTPLDEALGYQKALKELGITQDELAKRLGNVSQGQISNRLRLLALPKEWRKKIISHEITASQARDLVPWADFPEVLDEIEKQFEDSDDEDEVEKIADLSPAEWDSLMTDAINEAGEKLEGYTNFGEKGHNYRDYDISSVDAETRERLRVVEVKCKYGRGQKIELCFNRDLWKELALADAERRVQEQREKSQKHIAEKSKEHKSKKPGEKKGPTAEELKQQAAQLNKRLYRYKLAWLQKSIAERADKLSERQLQAFMFSLCVSPGSHEWERLSRLTTAAKAAGVKLATSHSDAEKIWPSMASIDLTKLRLVQIEFVKVWCALPAKSYSTDAHPSAIETVAADLGIDIAQSWSVDEDFLGIHTIDQLGGLEKEWHISAGGSGKAGKIKAILDASSTKKLPAPKELLKVTPVKLLD